MELVALKSCIFFATKLNADIAAVLFLRNAERLKTDRKYAITNVWDENTKAVVKNPKSEKKYSKNMCLTTYASKCNAPKY